VPHGPANRIAAGAVALDQRFSAAELGPLHQAGINLFTREADGIRLQGGRTLATGFGARQLSVRRTMLMLRRVLAGQRWAVFEGNGPQLWSRLEALLDIELRRLWQAGALSGARQEEAYFIRIDRDMRRLARGEVLVEIGVALAEPLEFLLIRLVRDGDGTLQLESAA
jgi:phage tail sheath protein FI